MIPRYDVPEVSAVWSDEARLGHWLEIELLAVEAWAELGVVPAAEAAACRERAAFTVDAVLERERVTRHDIAAFVDVVAASIGEPGRWIHYGLTSVYNLAFTKYPIADPVLGVIPARVGLVLSARRYAKGKRPYGAAVGQGASPR